MGRWVLTTAGLMALMLAEAGQADKPASASHGLEPLVRVLAASDDIGVQRDVLQGMHEALQGRRRLTPPEGWSAVRRKLAASPDAEVRQLSLRLSVMFGDSQALASLRQTAADPAADAAARRSALQTLVETRAPGLLPLLRELITDPTLRGPALRALAAFDDPQTPALILHHYASFPDRDRADAIATLASRPAYALALLEAIAQGQVPRRDLSPFTARQIANLKDRRVTGKLTKVWGTLRPPAHEKSALLARYLALVPPAALAKADRSHGRAVFARTCAACHMLFREGGKIGPDLTGSQRTNPEYILSKVLDPNAVVARDYQVTIIATTDGRTLSGLVKEETPKVLTLQTQNEIMRLAKADIEERRQSAQSMMPEGQLATMSDMEIRDLVAYLAGPDQVPLPAPARLTGK
jgi:putative heme-binding domain-containing protein